MCTVIGYNTNDSIEWQRVSCCKEMVHIFDDPVEKTKSADELEGLVVKLLGPMSTDDIGRADIMAMKDKFALYQCLPLLLPDAARAVCLELLADGKTTKEKIAKLACIPQQLCDRMLGDDWPKLLESLLDC